MVFKMRWKLKSAKAFEKLLFALKRQSKDDSVRNKNWVRLWSQVADYSSYLWHKEKKP
jgi:hypothetical protein